MPPPDRLNDRGRDELAELGGDSCHQALLGAEVVGDQRLVLAGARRDLGDREAGIAVGLHHLQAGIEQAVASPARGPAGPSAQWGRLAQAAASIAGSSPIAASFFESDLAAYSKISDEW